MIGDYLGTFVTLAVIGLFIYGFFFSGKGKKDGNKKGKSTPTQSNNDNGEN